PPVPGCGPLDGRKVDVGREVLPSDGREWVVVHPVAAIGPERPATAGRPIEDVGPAAVVDEDREPALERGGHVGGPWLDLQADLGSLPVAQLDPLGGKAFREGRCRGLARAIDEAPAAVVAPVDEDLPQPATRL